MIFGVEVKDIILTLLTATLAGVGFLVRKIFTSERKIAVLETALMEMKDERKEHDQYVDSMLNEVRQDIKDLLRR